MLNEVIVLEGPHNGGRTMGSSDCNLKSSLPASDKVRETSHVQVRSSLNDFHGPCVMMVIGTSGTAITKWHVPHGF